MELPLTMEEVLAELDRIIETSLRENSPMAIFAWIYRRTTAEIKKGVEAQLFADNERMAHFDVTFANYYIRAVYDYTNGLPVSESWKVAFDGTKQPLCIVQHIILGMNAHINLDLGVAAGCVMDGKQLDDLQADFMKVNTVLFSLTKELEDGLGRVSPLFFLVNWFGKRSDEQLIDFSIEKARDCSWITANRVWSAADGTKKEQCIRQSDNAVAALGKVLCQPKGWFFRRAIILIRWFESKDMRKIVGGLKMIPTAVFPVNFAEKPTNTNPIQ